MSVTIIQVYQWTEEFQTCNLILRQLYFTHKPFAADLTCQSQGYVPVVSSHTHERWVHPNWHRSSGGWSQASERRKVPRERKVGSFLLRAAASGAVESGWTEMERSLNLFLYFALAACALLQCMCLRCHHYLLDICVQLEYLSFSFHLSHTDLTGELWHSQAASLQTEGAVQRSLTTTPNVIEWDLLWDRHKC